MANTRSGRPYRRPTMIGSKRAYAPNTTTGVYRKITRRVTSGPRATGSISQQIRSLQRVVKNLSPEIKYLDVTNFLANIPATGSVGHISQIAQSDLQGGRTGSTINLTSLSVKATFTRAADDVGGNDKLQWAIVVDKGQVADTTPTAGAVFASTDPFFALPNLGNVDRFRFLYVSKALDCRQMGLDSDNTAPATRDNCFEFQWTGNLKISYNGAATSDIEKNGIYCVALSTAASLQDFACIARLGYTDV